MVFEEIKKILEEQSDAKVFPLYLKAISEIYENNEELKDRIKDMGIMKVNFDISKANVVAHIETNIEVSISGGKGLYKYPDLTSVITEEIAKDAILRKSSVESLWTNGVMDGRIKISGNLGKAMKQMPNIDEGDEALCGYKSKEKMPENVKKIKDARDSGEWDIELFITWLNATEETEGEFMKYLTKKYAKTVDTIRFNYKIPSAGIGAHYGQTVKRSLLSGEGKLDEPDFTIELSEEIAEELMHGKISLSAAYNAGYIEVEREHIGKLTAMDPFLRIASEELGIKM